MRIPRRTLPTPSVKDKIIIIALTYYTHINNTAQDVANAFGNGVAGAAVSFFAMFYIIAFGKGYVFVSLCACLCLCLCLSVCLSVCLSLSLVLVESDNRATICDLH